MITPQTYIQEYIHTYIHIKPLPVPRVFGARSGSPRIILPTMLMLDLLVYVNALLWFALEFT